MTGTTAAGGAGLGVRPLLVGAMLRAATFEGRFEFRRLPDLEGGGSSGW